MRVHGKRVRQLLGQVAAIDLDVARLVRHLAGGVELGLGPRHRVHDLRGGEQRALLAVQELRQHPAELVHAHALQLPQVELAGRIEHGVEGLGRKELGKLLGVDGDGPVDVGGGVPLQALALLVQVDQPLATERVVPVEHGLRGLGDGFERTGGGQRYLHRRHGTSSGSDPSTSMSVPAGHSTSWHAPSASSARMIRRTSATRSGAASTTTTAAWRSSVRVTATPSYDSMTNFTYAISRRGTRRAMGMMSLDTGTLRTSCEPGRRPRR